MNCEEARDRLMDLLCGILSPEARERLETHLRGCPACRAERVRLEAQEALLFSHFRELRRPVRRFWKPLAAAAALLLSVGIFWALRPTGGGPEPAYGEIQVRKLGFTVTVFNKDLALVRDRRQVLNLRPGVNRFRFQDVPARLDPESVRFRSETDPEGCRVLEQNFEYDLVSREKLLERYVDREVAFERVMKEGALERLQGTVLSSQGLTRMEGGEVRGFPGAAILPELPGGLVTRPALSWVLEAPRERTHEVTLAYLTAGMSWKADYVLTLKDAGTLDLDGWASVTNGSGATYEDARLKLLAGDPHRAEKVLKVYGGGRSGQKREEGSGTLEEKAFFEYHLYTLESPTTLKDQETKQLSLLAAKGVAYRAEDVCQDGTLRTEIVFRNEKANRLGMPLPKGTVRILARDPDDGGELEQVGLASLEHTPRDEEVRLPWGAPVDLVAERRETDFRRAGALETRTVEVRIRNHGAGARTVKVLETLAEGWEIRESSRPFERKSAVTAAFAEEVPAGGEAVLTYVYERRLP